MAEKTVAICALAAFALTAAAAATATVTQLGQFAPGLGALVGCAVDTDGSIWVYGDLDSTLSKYTAAGQFVLSIPRPGEAADDADIEIVSEEFTLGTTTLPAGTLVFINGESGAADLYAVNKTTGAVLASLTTAFGVSHVVGGAYHPGRNTFFLLQDQVPGGANANRLAEIDPISGAVLNNFQISSVFAVNFGDLEVNETTGHLLLVSSLESTIAEFRANGQFIQEFALPAGVTLLSGIGIDNATGEAWVSATGGSVRRLGGLPHVHLPGDVTKNGSVNVDDLLAVIVDWGACPAPPPAPCPADVDHNGTVNVDDLLLVIVNWS